MELIHRLTQPRVGGDLSSVINRIVSEWRATRDKLPPE